MFKRIRVATSALVSLCVSVLAITLIACGGKSSSGGTNPPPVSTYSLTVASSNPANGIAIAVSPSDISGDGNGTTSFTRTYDAGAQVTLTAPATSGVNTFASWTGCTSAQGAACTVTLNANTTVTANYTTPAPTVYTLSVNSSNPASGVAVSVSPNDNNGSGNGSTSFTRSYNAGTAVALTAPATSGDNTFTSWTGCASTSGTNGATCNVTLNADTTVTANYATPAPTVYTLTVNSGDPASGVAVAVSPNDNNGSGSGSTSFTRSYDAGTVVTLTAPATLGNGNTFGSWTGCATAAAAVCTVTLNADTTVTANYSTPAPVTYTLTVASSNPASGVSIAVTPADVNGSGTGSSGFTRTYDAGTAVTLTAPATLSNGNTFSSWTGCATAAAAVCNVTLNANTTVTANYAAPTMYTLTVASTNPASGVGITVTPADANNAANGVTGFTRSYVAGTAVTLTAPATETNATFSSWSGCAAATNVTCSIVMNANTTVSANYTVTNGVTSVSVAPGPTTVTVGQTQQFTATVQGNGTYGQGITWSVSAPSGCTDSPGTITASGLYTTPYPACSSVIVTATSTSDTTKSGSATVTLAAPAAGSGPSLTVNAGTVTHAINPLIYGINAFLLDNTSLAQANFSNLRWGGGDASRYNYLTNTANANTSGDFENFTGTGGIWPNTSFNDFVTAAAAAGVPAIGQANVLGWVSNNNLNNSSTSGYGASGPACSFQKAAFPDQTSYDNNCGDGIVPNGSGTQNLDGTDTNSDVPSIAAITSIAVPPPTPPGAGNPIGSSWDGNWVTAVVNQFGPGNPSTGTGKGVSDWELDNEPENWSSSHRDVHPAPMTYDELTNGGIGAALAIKTADPTAQVSGPVISSWYDYFYSQEELNNPGVLPCYAVWDSPTDREAHGGVPLIEYYLQQMKDAEATYGMRLLDYVDVHGYYAGWYNGTPTGLTSAGDTGAQMARMESTRALWDPTYGDPNDPYQFEPTYPPATGESCNTPAKIDLIPRMEQWVANDYPGTKTAISEYNFGGGEAINGAVVQADILGIFGMYGLDRGDYWPTINDNQQIPINMAFAIYRNYDGKDSMFGDQALSSTSSDQDQLAVYGSQRTSDGAVTVVVINKTYGPLTSTLTLPGVTPTGAAQVYLYSNANLNSIVPQSSITLTAPVAPATAYTLNASFPAQSITLFVVPTE